MSHPREDERVAHSPLPWRVGVGDERLVFAADASSVAHCDLHGRALKDDDIANAALIVKAVNCHQELVEALRDSVAVLSGDHMTKQALIDALEKSHAILEKVGQ